MLPIIMGARYQRRAADITVNPGTMGAGIIEKAAAEGSIWK